MAQFSLVTLFIVVAIAACQAAPHIIGGSINTGTFNTNRRKSIFSNLDISSNNQERTANEEQGNNVDALDNLSALPQGVDSGLIRINLPPPVFSGMNRGSAFIRRKRQACQMTRGLAQNLRQLFSGLNDTMFLGRTPQQPSVPRIPVNQSPVCPNSIDLSSTEDRLRSNCPWNLSRRDLGANSYPRYVAEATCVCNRCIDTSPGYTCQALRAPVTYFELDSCQDGMALMAKKTASVVVGCFCAAPERTQVTDQRRVPATDPPLDD